MASEGFPLRPVRIQRGRPTNKKRPWKNQGLFDSSSGRARTYDKRINSGQRKATITRKKPMSNDFPNSRASVGASEFCSTELQEWIESCPVELEDWQLKSIVAVVHSCALQLSNSLSLKEKTPREHDQRVISL